MIHPELLQLYDRAYELRCNDGYSFNNRLLELTTETGTISAENLVILNQIILNDFRPIIANIINPIPLIESIITYSYNILNNLENNLEIENCSQWLKESIYQDTIQVIELGKRLLDIELGINDL